jgi:hypothetical protein
MIQKDVKASSRSEDRYRVAVELHFPA